MEVGDLIVTLNMSLDKLKKRNGPIQPSDMSADIIVNGALIMLCNIYRKELEPISNSYSHEEQLEIRRVLSFPIRQNARELVHCTNLTWNIAVATNKIIRGLTEEDILYVVNEIFTLVEHEESEATITNYFINKHGFNPFNLY